MHKIIKVSDFVDKEHSDFYDLVRVPRVDPGISNLYKNSQVKSSYGESYDKSYGKNC